MRVSGKNLFYGVWLRLPSLCEYNSARTQLGKCTLARRRIRIAECDWHFRRPMVVNRRSKRSGISAVIFIFIFVLVCLPALALPPRAIVLHSGWRFRALNDSVHSGVEQWHEAQVPSVVQM